MTWAASSVAAFAFLKLSLVWAMPLSAISCMTAGISAEPNFGIWFVDVPAEEPAGLAVRALVDSVMTLSPLGALVIEPPDAALNADWLLVETFLIWPSKYPGRHRSVRWVV